ncbi:MAG: DEAD/DEAH box helicase [Thermoguttaceae bacterium]|jgi:superfamily II DNA/RNA helicase|nr:DEAD/DEAH box helicase [Thermoguttaceae bacterium]
MSSDPSYQSPTRDELAERYFDQLPYEPYPVQEEGLLAWFSSDQGVLVCAPTGMGKTVIAEAALFEALHTGKRAYYTTPLIALTEQKFREMQENAIRWGFSPGDVGLVTGNRRENPDARVLVVVAEILFNRLLHRELFDFDDVAAVVMDEFHSFNDRERGIVWEFSLGLLPPHVRLLLLSATVGNARQFIQWLRLAHQRKVELVEGDERRVPLTFQWIDDRLLSEQMELMARGPEDARFTPSLIFCFNREQCWNVAEQLKGKSMLSDGQQERVAAELKRHDMSPGAGPKLRQLLLRGVGVHHAGVLPKYRRVVEELFQRKLLSVAVCTETLSAGINLPARSVVLPSILKGPTGKKTVVETSTAHQIFGRAGRPQFDTRGFVFVLAHEDDVKIGRWRRQYDQIPEDTKDPNLIKAKKRLKKKAPKRRATEQYWSEAQFDKLRAALPGNLHSTGPVPWRLLAYMLEASPEVDLIRRLVSKRLMEGKRLERAQQQLDRMLLTLWRAGYVELEPTPPKPPEPGEPAPGSQPPAAGADDRGPTPSHAKPTLFGEALSPDGSTGNTPDPAHKGVAASPGKASDGDAASGDGPEAYRPELARPTPELGKLLLIRGMNPLFGVFLVNQLGIANFEERIQALESVLDMPGTVARLVRVPGHDELPPGPLAVTRLDEQLLRLGLVTEEQLVEPADDEDWRRRSFEDARPRVLALAEKLRLLFDYDFPDVHDVRTTAVWSAGELLQFGGDFNKYVTSRQLQKQEGIVFRHLLRLILLTLELRRLSPPDDAEGQWEAELGELADRLTECCRKVDPSSTEHSLETASQPADPASLM